MVFLAAWSQHRLGRTGYFLPCIIMGLILEAYPASVLDPTTPFPEYVSANWTHKDGLRSTFIRSIAQTAAGYIWLGTTDGLFRFDGVRFIQWRTKEQHGLGVVNVLCAARDGSLLVAPRRASWAGFREKTSCRSDPELRSRGDWKIVMVRSGLSLETAYYNTGQERHPPLPLKLRCRQLWSRDHSRIRAVPFG